LLDVKMPNMDGIEAIGKLKSDYPDIRVLILTMYDDEHFILHLMEAGASGYLVKNTDPEEIKKAIHAVVENGYYFSDLVSSVMLKTLVSKNIAKPKFKPEIKLTDKEKEVLQLICAEHTNAEIGQKLFLSPRTIEGIRSSLLERIGVRNTAGLVLYAVKQGIYKEGEG
ncbi:MAG: response regulator transcription factor, partial [Sphingobacteriales bacterium]